MSTTITINAVRLTADAAWYSANDATMNEVVQYLSISYQQGVWNAAAQTFTPYGSPGSLTVEAYQFISTAAFWTMRGVLMNSINQQIAPSSSTVLSLVFGCDLAGGAVYASQ